MTAFARCIIQVNAGDVPGATFLTTRGNAKTDAFVIKSEDPLFAIKRDEQEARTRILNNPAQLKRIKSLVGARVHAWRG